MQLGGLVQPLTNASQWHYQCSQVWLIGVVAVQGLQAQGKPKAYTVSELELLPTA